MTMSASARQGGLYGIVKGDSVRLRSSMDTSSTNNLVGLINRGERLNITQEYTAWAYGAMTDGGNVGNWGYVSKGYLTLYQQ